MIQLDSDNFLLKAESEKELAARKMRKDTNSQIWSEIV